MIKNSRKFYFKKNLQASFVADLFYDQFTYGHREILLDFMKLDHTHAFLGRIMHGSFTEYDDVSTFTVFINGKLAPYWTFNSEILNLKKNKFKNNIIDIGAPWLYLDKKSSSNKIENTFLIMPEHATENYLNSTTKKEKMARAKAFREIVGENKATVCLHYIDFCDLETRNAFDAFGFSVTCLGVANNRNAISPAGDRVNFLRNLNKLFSDHTHWVGEGFGTSLLYAAATGLNIGVFPEIRKFSKFGYRGVGTQEDWTRRIFDRNLSIIKRDIPSVLDNFSKSNATIDFANIYLGLKHKKEPGELFDLMKPIKNIF